MVRSLSLLAPLVSLLLVVAACAAPAPPAAPAAAPPPAAAASPPAAAEMPAWQRDWEQTVAAARQEGRVVVMGPPGDTIREAMASAFRKAYPDLTLEWSGARGNEIVAKVSAERRGDLTTIDVALLGTENLPALRGLDAVAPVNSSLVLPEVTDPSKWLDGRIEYSDSERVYNPVFIGIVGPALAYNPGQVRPDEVDELGKLLDPKWRGRLVMHDPLLAGSSLSMVRWFWYALGPERATEFLRGLAAQQPVVDRETRRELEGVARGRYPVLFGPSDSMLQQLTGEGLQFGMVTEFRDVGGYTTPSSGSLVITKGAPHANAAKVFVNWLLSRDGQTAYSSGLTQASRRLDVPRGHLNPLTVPQPGGKYWPAYTEEHVKMPPELEALLRELFTG